MLTFRTFSERVLVSQFCHKLEGLFLLVKSTRLVYTSSPKLCAASLMDLPDHGLMSSGAAVVSSRASFVAEMCHSNGSSVASVHHY